MGDRDVRAIPILNTRYFGCAIVIITDAYHTKITFTLRILQPELSIGFALWKLNMLG